jgi:hypothetical protein
MNSTPTPDDALPPPHPLFPKKEKMDIGPLPTTRRRAYQPSHAVKAQRKKSLEKANRERDKLKLKREVAREKIKKGLPVTEEEVLAAGRSFGYQPKGGPIPRDKISTEPEAAIVLKPQTINALRVIVEATAAASAYNPIQGLLDELKDPDLSAKDRVAIHKTLLPFLMPMLSPAKEEHVEQAPQQGKVVIKNFVLPEAALGPIHQSKRDALANAVDREDQRDDAEARRLMTPPVTEPSISPADDQPESQE